jgi:hypothetical protein
LIEFPWLERRENGYWFQVHLVTPSEPPSNLEDIQMYTASNITELERRNCKYSLPNVGTLGGFKPLE